MRKFIAKINGKEYEVEIDEIISENSSSKELNTRIETKIDNSHQAKELPKGQTTNVTAPMPGTVMSVNVKINNEVKSGDIICVLEAMKMENEICAPKSGKISSIKIENGDKVKSGDILVVIE